MPVAWMMVGARSMFWAWRGSLVFGVMWPGQRISIGTLVDSG